jgi:Uncharacterized protein conserved in bacteria
MSGTDWLVIAGGLGAAVWVNWYFFLAERSIAHAGVATTNDRGAQEVRITVRGGYEPATIRVAAGRPVRLVFDRQETSSCSEEVGLSRLRVAPVSAGEREHLARGDPAVARHL